MQNPLKLLSHATSTKSVHRVGLTVNGKLNTQLNSGHLLMYFPKKSAILTKSPTITWGQENESLHSAEKK